LSRTDNEMSDSVMVGASLVVFPYSWRAIIALLPVVLFAVLLAECVQQPRTPIPLVLAPQTQGTGYQTGIVPATLAPAGDYRIVTVRQRSDSLGTANVQDSHEIVCSEPSPDWATALAAAQSITGSGGITGGASGSLSASNSSTETITALAGRTAGVVALRDGLYASCQAYANGVIGKDAYALVLSQYGNLLVALAGGSGGGASSGGSSSSGTTAPSGVAVAVSAGATPSGTGSPLKDSSGNVAPSGSSMVAQIQQEQLQAMLVACITESDKTVFPLGSNNAALEQACPALLAAIGKAEPDLVKPQSSDSATDTTLVPVNKTVAKPDPTVAALKQKLVAAGETVVVDGVWGNQTDSEL
jgi:hypothetical protein